jgi:hypothetical protein
VTNDALPLVLMNFDLINLHESGQGEGFLQFNEISMLSSHKKEVINLSDIVNAKQTTLRNCFHFSTVEQQPLKQQENSVSINEKLCCN